MPMKRWILIFAYIFSCLFVTAQSKGPEFPGGEEKLQQFLKENVQYPYFMNSRKTYNVKAEVLVAKDGTVTFFDILKPDNPKREITNETKRVIKMMPKWNPGGHYADDGTFVPEQWKTVIFISFNPMSDFNDEITCINVKKAGTLESLLTQEQKDTCSQLRIMGKINSADIITLRKMAGEDGCLVSLDLSGARILASKEPYLRVENAEKKLSLWSHLVQGEYSYTPSWIRIPDSERKEYFELRNREWGANQNKQYTNNPGRYMRPTPYQVPYRERTHVSGAWNSFKKWWSGDSSSYGQTAICLFEGNSENATYRKTMKIKPIHFKGHCLVRNGDEYLLTAHTVKNSFCQDMFYNCPKLRQVIVPLNATMNERSVVDNSRIFFSEAAWSLDW